MINDADGLLDDELDDDPLTGGEKRTPVHVVGRIIARSPLGAAWCAFVDGCASPGRAERGRVYVRAGALLDLKVRPGRITAEMANLRPIVMVALKPGGTADQGGHRGAEIGDLLPDPMDLGASCGCNDRVPLCEHVLAALYGFGARLDAEPEQMMLLRGAAATGPAPSTSLVIGPLAPEKIALTGGLAALFGLNLRDEPLPVAESVYDAAGPEPPPDREKSLASDAIGDVGEDVPDTAQEVGSPDVGSLPTSSESHADNQTTPDEAAERRVEVRRDYLKFIGIRSRTIDIWVREGVLLPTDRFHVYLRTPEANRRISAKLAR